MTSSNTDVLVVGGGAAGAAAALQFGRLRRSVVIVDAGEPRNAPAAAMHGFVGHDGRPPSDFRSIAHGELKAYGIEPIAGRVVGIEPGGPDRLVATLGDGREIAARRVLLATGLTDLLPDIPGVRELWGRQVIHCPWCHGWEARDRPVAVLDTTGAGVHQALLLAQLSTQVVLVGDGGTELDAVERRRLTAAGVRIEPRQAGVVELEPGPESSETRVRVTLDDGAMLIADTVAVAPRFRPNVAMAGALDLAVANHPLGLGTHLDVGADGRTSNPSVYAAGNVADPFQQVLHAAADGSRVAMAIVADLIEADLDVALKGLAAAAADAEAWNERYRTHDDSMWSGRPNGSLVAELSEVPTVGRALDVGCGEGADAVWLAERGWTVTATDISEVAVERGRRAAEAAGLDVDWRIADLATEPPEADAYDLVTLSYPAIRADDGQRALDALTAAVAPGGRLVVIGHASHDRDHDHSPDHDHDHGPDHDHSPGHDHDGESDGAGFDPAAFVSLDELVEQLGATLTIERDEERDRPDPPVDAAHLRDRILVARRPD